MGSLDHRHDARRLAQLRQRDTGLDAANHEPSREGVACTDGVDDGHLLHGDGDRPGCGDDDCVVLTVRGEYDTRTVVEERLRRIVGGGSRLEEGEILVADLDDIGAM